MPQYWKPTGTRWSRGLSATAGSAAMVVTMMFISIPQGPGRIIVPRHRSLSPGGFAIATGGGLSD